MAGPTYDEVIAAARRASEAGAADDARVLMEYAMTLRPVGIPEASSAGLARGIAGLADLPGALLSGAGALVERGAQAAGIEQPEFFRGMREALEMPFGAGSRARDALSAATGGMSEARPQTFLGRAAGTVGEFVPGAMAGGARGPAQMLQYAIAPGVASEAAGELTQGTTVGGVPIEPFARFGAAVAAPSAVGRIVSPLGGAAPERLAAAQRLREEGIPVRAGEETGSSTLRALEGSMEPTEEQARALTAAAMRSIGSDAPVASPAALRDARTRIVTDMNDAVAGLTATVPAGAIRAAERALARYEDTVGAGSRMSFFNTMMNRLRSGANGVSLDRLASWRRALGEQTVADDMATREAAHTMRSIIDAITDRELSAAGRADDLARLRNARREYQNFIAIRAASAQSDLGVISPNRLNTAVRQAQGRERFAMGEGTGLEELSQAAAGVLRSEPTVSPGAVRTIAGAGPAAAGYAAAQQFAPGNELFGMMGGLAASGAMGAMLRSPAAQAYLRNQLMQPAQGVLSRVAPTAYTSATNRPQ